MLGNGLFSPMGGQRPTVGRRPAKHLCLGPILVAAITLAGCGGAARGTVQRVSTTSSTLSGHARVEQAVALAHQGHSYRVRGELDASVGPIVSWAGIVVGSDEQAVAASGGITFESRRVGGVLWTRRLDPQGPWIQLPLDQPIDLAALSRGSEVSTELRDGRGSVELADQRTSTRSVPSPTSRAQARQRRRSPWRTGSSLPSWCGWGTARRPGWPTWGSRGRPDRRAGERDRRHQRALRGSRAPHLRRAPRGHHARDRCEHRDVSVGDWSLLRGTSVIDRALAHPMKPPTAADVISTETTDVYLSCGEQVLDRPRGCASEPSPTAQRRHH